MKNIKKFLPFALALIVFAQAPMMPVSSAHADSRLINPNVDAMKSMLNQREFRVYFEDAPENYVYCGAKLEPRTGVYTGAATRGASSYSWFDATRTNDVEQRNMIDGSTKSADNAALRIYNWNFQMRSSENINPADYENYIKNVVDGLAQRKENILLVFAKEMNINNNFKNTDDFINMFRYIADYARTKDNIAMVWGPNDTGSLDFTFEMWYPGDEYVDWIGMSSYTIPHFLGDRGKSTESNNVSFVTGDYANPVMRIKPIIEFMARNNIKKPVLLTESGVGYEHTKTGEDFTDWASLQMRRLYGEAIRRFPEIKVIVDFDNHVASDFYRYDTSNNPALKKLMQEMLQDPVYASMDDYRKSAPVSYSQMRDNLRVKGSLKLSAYAYNPKSSSTPLTVKYILDGTQVHESSLPPYYCALGNLAGTHRLTVQMFNGSAMLETKSYDIEFEKEPEAGDPIGDVVYTDIRAYINGCEIPASNINGYAQIIVEDLVGYGFDVAWDAAEKTLKVERNEGKAMNPAEAEGIPDGKKPGDLKAKYVLSAIKVYLSGELVESYSINGRMFIDFNLLGKYGTVAWDGSARMLSCELK
ncbi:MAG: hypothetical protein FWG34_01720 [Oscillospiraceae bacterium]|nr:hypothetical protein [Oscillospiraceae bacterium]